MAWCHQVTSHYLGQCWPRSMSPYGITRPQWVKMIEKILNCKLEPQKLCEIYDTPFAKLKWPQGPLWQYRLTLIPAWMSNYIHHKVCDEITFPSPNFNGATVEVWEWISNFIMHFTGHMITYPCLTWTPGAWMWLRYLLEGRSMVPCMNIAAWPGTAIPAG